MSKSWEPLLQDLRNVCLAIRQQAQQTEAKVEHINVLLRELHRNGAVGDRVVVGPVLFTRAYPPVLGGSSTGEIIQAMLTLDGGIGVAFWDSEVHAELSRIDEGLDSLAKMAFIPFHECDPALQAALCPHVEAMVAQLWRSSRSVRDAFRSEN